MRGEKKTRREVTDTALIVCFIFVAFLETEREEDEEEECRRDGGHEKRER